MNSDDLVYDMEGWEPEERVELGRLLDEAGIAHRWDGDELVVPETEEERVDGLMDRIEFPDALEAEDDDDEEDDQAGYEVMSALYLAADRLAADPVIDVDGAGGFMAVAAAAVAAAPPYGVDASSWRQVQELAQSIMAAIDAEADDDAIGRDAAALRNVLRRFV